MIFYLKGTYNMDIIELSRLVCLNLSSVDFWNFLNFLPSYLRQVSIAFYIFIVALAI
jgi:hypothetical protein